MNFRTRTHPVVLGGTAVALGAVVWMTVPRAEAVDPALAAGPQVSFATAQAIVELRCVTCHAERPTNPSFTAPPLGVMLDTPERIHAQAQRIFVRSVQTHTMPLGNMTFMSDEERKLLGAWVAQGADTSAPGPIALPSVAPATPPEYASAAEEARALFVQRCVPCHGPEGRGDGPSSQALNPKPRNYHDAEWQQSTKDSEIALAILLGGMSVGKSDIMPGNPDLAEKPEVVTELVRLLRSFGQKDTP
jgi:mono/diheme cytochrome c family protein